MVIKLIFVRLNWSKSDIRVVHGGRQSHKLQRLRSFWHPVITSWKQCAWSRCVWSFSPDRVWWVEFLFELVFIFQSTIIFMYPFDFLAARDRTAKSNYFLTKHNGLNWQSMLVIWQCRLKEFFRRPQCRGMIHISEP